MIMHKPPSSARTLPKKGVSPVVATILLLTISVALMTVAFVAYRQYEQGISTGGGNAQLELVGITAYDFNADGKGDAIYLTLKNTGIETAEYSIDNVQVSLTNETMALSGWTIFNGTDTIIEPQNIGYIVLITNSATQQISIPGGYTIGLVIPQIGELQLQVNLNELQEGGKVRIVVSSPIVASLLLEAQNLVQNGQAELARELATPQLSQTNEEFPLPGATVRIIDQYGFEVGAKQSSSTGTTFFSLLPGNYSVKVSFGDVSITTDPFLHPANVKAPYEDTIVHAKFSSVINKVTVRFTVGNTPKANVPIYAIQITTIGTRAYETIVAGSPIFSDANGTATFFLTSGEYKFQALYLGASVKTTTYSIQTEKFIQINVDVGPIVIHITDELGTALPSTWISLYGVQGTASTYLSSRYTNSTGYAEFGGVLTERFKISIYSIGFVSDTYLTVPGNVYEIVIPGKTLYINATSTSGTPVANLYFYAYDSNGRYVGYGRTNQSGIGYLLGLKPDNYSLTYYLSWTSTYKTTINFVNTTIYNITLPGILIFANITALTDLGGGNYTVSPLPNQWVYLMKQSNGQYVGWGYTNDTGVATFLVDPVTYNPNDTYVFRTWYYSNGLWSSYTSPPFNLTDGKIVNMTVGGVPIYFRVIDNTGQPAYGFRGYLFDPNTDWWTSYAWSINSTGWGVLYGIPGKEYFISVAHGSLTANSTLFNATSGYSYQFPAFTRASFTVRVLNENGQAVSNRAVYLYVQDKYYGYALYYASATTNGAGRARFNGYAGADYLARTWFGTYYLTGFITGVTNNAVYTLQPNIVYIRLLAQDGTPIANRYFYVYLAGTNTYITWGGYTNATGYRQLSLPIGGPYEVRVYGLGTRYAVSSPFNITQANQVVSLTFDVVRVYARAQDENGTPLNDILGYGYYMYLYTSNGTYVSYGYSNATGWVTFYALNGSDYQAVLTYFGRRIESAVFTAYEGTTVSVTITGFRIYANVTRDGQPVQNTWVYLYTEANRYSGWARTNSSGIATFVGILNGTYYMRAYLNGYYAKSDLFNASQGLVVNITSVSQPVTIKVYQFTGGFAQGVYVYLNSIEGYWIYGGTTNNQGEITITASLNVIYKARAYMRPTQNSAYTWVVSKFFNNTGSQGIIEMRPTPISVKVVDGADRPVAGQYVNLLQNGTYDSYGYTDGTGTATLWGVYNTTYYVRAYRYGFDYYNFTSFTTPSNDTTVYTGVNIGGGHVYVQILDPQGAPIANSRVTLYAQSSTYSVASADTNSTGWAVFQSVGNGTLYRIYSVDVANYSSYFRAIDGLTIVMQQGSGQIQSVAPTQIFIATTIAKTKRT